MSLESSGPGPFVSVLGQAAVIVAMALILGIGANAWRTQGIPLQADWSAEARLQDGSGNQMAIGLEAAKTLFLQGRAVFIDARSASDYRSGHIQGAVSLPWQGVDERFVQVAPQLEGGGTLITYCDGETCELSHNLARFLLDMGFEDVRVLINGWRLWKNAGLPRE